MMTEGGLEASGPVGASWRERVGRVLALLACGAQAACARGPDSIEARYVSPNIYQNWTCEQLVEERLRLTGEVQRVSGLQRENAAADTVMMAVGIVVFWPVLFGLAMTKDRKDELGRLKGEYDAVDLATRSRSCTAPTQNAPSVPTVPVPPSLETPSDEGGLAAKRAAEEDVRLLYVAMTRARDYLVLAVDQVRGASRAAVLDALIDGHGNPLVKLPLSDGDPLEAAGSAHSCRVWMLAEEVGQGDIAGHSEHPAYDAIASCSGLTVVHPPYRFRPSEAEPGGGGARILERIALGPRLALTSTPDMAALGEAVHRFLAADSSRRSRETRQGLAEELMRRWGVGGALSPADVVTAADRLSDFILAKWPHAPILREWPIAGRLGLQRVQGRIDLLVDTAEGLVLVDHKTYPGRPETWEERVLGYASQLGVYGRLCEAATGKPVVEKYVHLPVAGVILCISNVL